MEDISDDLHSMSFNSITTAATDIHRSTSSSSETTTWTASASSSFNHHSTTTTTKKHPPGDTCRDAIRSLSLSTSPLSFSHLRFLHRLGSGDIGSVYLTELKQQPTITNSATTLTAALFAAKVMDKKELSIRNKEGRARTEKEILEMMEHPFLPTLYGCVDSSRWCCLLTEFCPGGDLHVLRQRQPNKRFTESSVRFYASEVVVALEYLHMMGIVYRDLKPENVLVRADGHIMLTDFDLSLKCDDSQSTPAQVISSQNTPNALRPNDYFIDPPKFTTTSCILPNCIVPSVSCFNPRRKRKKKKKPGRDHKPEVVAEPVDVRSMSFVGTHEYLAPEIVSGEGHGSAVDWWTLGIFIFELFHGVTPFRGIDHEQTLANIVARALEFPKEPGIPSSAKDLISQLLAKDPARRMGSTMGASAIKNHPFFQGVNWALLRCTTPPFVPPLFSRDVLKSDQSSHNTPVDYY
ncbi:hypothetical protein Leryth_003980 [Lithospermum erythrorhizon]|nr:hypothetical protein Leryth_003980 [Lithospermum erythrorhizon]